MKKGLISSLMVVFLLACSLIFSSCSTLIGAAVVEGKHASNIKKEASITGANGGTWRNELAYDESKNKNMDSSGLWYIGGIPMILQNLSVNSKYNGISVLHFIQNNSYLCELALVATDDKPAGEVSSFTVKKLGDPGNNTWTIKYILSADGNSFNLTDLGGLNSPPLRIGQYLNSQGNTAARNAALEGYGELTICNMNSNLSITIITVNGGPGNTFSNSYRVNLRPSSGILPGGSFEVGEVISGKKVLPIGDYTITVQWSNGAQSTHRTSVNSRGGTFNIVNP